MSSTNETPAIEAEVVDEQEDEDNGLSVLGIIAVTFRSAYNNPVTGFGMDMLGIGSIVFAAVVFIMFSLVTLAGLLGGWTTLYALFVLAFGGYGAYRKRLA